MAGRGEKAFERAFEGLSTPSQRRAGDNRWQATGGTAPPSKKSLKLLRRDIMRIRDAQNLLAQEFAEFRRREQVLARHSRR